MVTNSYNYLPKKSSRDAELRTVSSTRGRLHAGGTYFRSRQTGLSQNNISVEVLEIEAPTASDGLGFCIVQNGNIDKTEMIVPNLTAQVLAGMENSTYEDLWIIERGTPHTIYYYTISCKIRFDFQNDNSTVLPAPIESKTFEFDKIVRQGKIAVKVTENTPPGASGTLTFITPRVKIYQLSKRKIDADTENPEYWVWDISNLRSQINANDPWIEMVDRPAAPATGSPAPTPEPNPNDVQDEGSDAIGLSPFTRTNLAGADGLPLTPELEWTGPFKSLIHVNYDEADNGELREKNSVYEWVGVSATEGSWQPFS